MKKWMKKIVALIIVLSLVCGLAPNLSLVARAEKNVSYNESLDNPTEEPDVDGDNDFQDEPTGEPDLEGGDDSTNEPTDDSIEEPDMEEQNLLCKSTCV